jgi:hypothetical protein
MHVAWHATQREFRQRKVMHYGYIYRTRTSNRVTRRFELKQYDPLIIIITHYKYYFLYVLVKFEMNRLL